MLLRLCGRLQTFTCLVLVFVILVFVISLPPFASASEDIFKKHPQIETYPMSNGNVVRLPVHYYHTEAMMLIGTADLDGLNQVLRPQNLRAAPLSRNKGMVAFYVVNHKSNSIGPYSEFLLLIAATRSTDQNPEPNPDLGDFYNTYASLLGFFVPPLAGPLRVDKTKTGFYVWKILVTEQEALLAGREIWGFPKDMAQIQYQTQSREKSFEVLTNVASETCVLKGKLGNRAIDNAPSLPLRINFNMITPYQIRRTWVPSMGEGTMKLDRFNPQRDMLDLESGSKCTQDLKSVHFQPLIWQYIPDLQALLFR
jgi:hypothetical protein